MKDVNILLYLKILTKKKNNNNIKQTLYKVDPNFINKAKNKKS